METKVDDEEIPNWIFNDSDKIRVLRSNDYGAATRYVYASTVNDVKKELITNFEFKKDSIINKLDLVSREEFEALKILVEKQDVKIKKLSKKTKKAKRS